MAMLATEAEQAARQRVQQVGQGSAAPGSGGRPGDEARGSSKASPSASVFKAAALKQQQVRARGRSMGGAAGVVCTRTC